jgi:hypothetical protein
MSSVVQRISEIKQPRGGYIKPKSFVVTEIDDGNGSLSRELENIRPNLVGLVVDYLTRAHMSDDPVEAFNISLRGAELIGELEHAIETAQSVVDLSPESITAACQLAGYDVCFRAGMAFYKPVQEILPDGNTIRNIEIMVRRSIRFFDEYGPVVEDGITFEGGYTDTVNVGDGDFITDDTLWDFKVLASEPRTRDTLQLLMYYLMGKRSIHENLHRITRLGIFNPRLNKVYLLNVSDIPPEVIKAVEDEVICY